ITLAHRADILIFAWILPLSKSFPAFIVPSPNDPVEQGLKVEVRVRNDPIRLALRPGDVAIQTGGNPVANPPHRQLPHTRRTSRLNGPKLSGASPHAGKSSTHDRPGWGAGS